MPGNTRHNLVESIFLNKVLPVGGIEKAWVNFLMSPSKYIPYYNSSCVKYVLRFYFELQLRIFPTCIHENAKIGRKKVKSTVFRISWFNLTQSYFKFSWFDLTYFSNLLLIQKIIVIWNSNWTINTINLQWPWRRCFRHYYPLSWAAFNLYQGHIFCLFWKRYIHFSAVEDHLILAIYCKMAVIPSSLVSGGGVGG